MRRAATAVSGVLGLGLMSGCLALSGPEIAPAAPIEGPTLVIAATNRSGDSRLVELEHEAAATSGVAAADVPCGSTVLEFGAVTGTYRLLVDGEEVAAGPVPGGADPTAFVVFQLEITADGTTSVVGPAVAQRAPQPPPMESCG